MEENYLIFEQLPPAKLLLKCAVPAAFSMIFSGLYSIADGIFVGHCIGSDALAAVNLVMPLIAIAFSLAELIATGSSVQLATLLGQKEYDRANRTFSVCIKVIVGMSFLIGLVFFFLCKPMLVVMGAGGYALQYSIEYIRVYAVFAPFIIVFFAVDNYLRICGKQNYSMILNIVTAVLNIVLDFLLIVILRQGIWAAAIASCISISLGTLMAFYPFIKNKLILKFVAGSSSFYNSMSHSEILRSLCCSILYKAGRNRIADTQHPCNAPVCTILSGKLDRWLSVRIFDSFRAGWKVFYCIYYGNTGPSSCGTCDPGSIYETGWSVSYATTFRCC